MKILNGSELAGFIKERQAKQVRSIRQSRGVEPKLAIVQTKDDPVINTYIRLKKAYGADIGIVVDSFFVAQPDVADKLAELNKDDSVHGIIVQLPLADATQTEKIVNLVSAVKDVDALANKSQYEPATPMAIMWLLAGYNVDLKNKHILLIGRGKLVGAPLERILKNSGYDVEVIDRSIKDLSKHTKSADVIITATGSPAVLYSEMIKNGAIVVDAGVASEEGKTVGDLDDGVYQREDLTLTPKKGGVGPLTVCALFENVIRAASK